MNTPYYMHAKDLLYNKHHHFIAKRILDTKQSMSFLNEQYTDILQWKKDVREYIFDRILYHPKNIRYTDRIVEEVDFGEYTRQKLYIRYNNEYEIPAYLLLPNNAKKPCPAAIVLHDHGGQFYWGKEKSVEHQNTCSVLKEHLETYYEDQPVASAMARRGYAVIVTDALLFGERRYPLEKNPLFAERLAQYPPDSEAYIALYNLMEMEVEWEFIRLMENAGLTSMGIRIADDMASVGYLAQRPEVDPTRICSIGLSMGGFRSGWLSAVDDRVKCSVLIGWMAMLSDMMKNRSGNFAPMWTISGLYGRLDYPDVISLAAPKRLMIMHGLKDGLFTHVEEGGSNKTGEKAIEIVRSVYRKAGCEENLDVKIYDLPHEFNRYMQEDAYVWLDNLLK